LSAKRCRLAGRFVIHSVLCGVDFFTNYKECFSYFA
jgi:hypothetical protein